MKIEANGYSASLLSIMGGGMSNRRSASDEATRKGEIWAVAGGKGGTGKSFLISSMGTCLARKHHRVVLVDFDLGGANLHTFLNVPQTRRSLTRFFESPDARLEDLIVPTGIDNLSLIAGDLDSVSPGTVSFSRKFKLLRHLAKLDTQYILVDLGAGCHPNILDAFLAADKMIALVVPEITSVENMYHFLKSALYRKLIMTLKTHGFKDAARHIWEQREAFGIRNLREFIDHLHDNLTCLGPILEKEVGGFKISLAVNMARDSQDTHLGASIKSIFDKYLGLKTLYAGCIAHDDAVWRSVRERRPLMLSGPASRASKEIEILVDNLVLEREIPAAWSPP